MTRLMRPIQTLPSCIWDMYPNSTRLISFIKLLFYYIDYAIKVKINNSTVLSFGKCRST